MTDIVLFQDNFLYSFTPEFQWSTYRYQINGWNSGTYKFIIEAHNEYGSYQTTWLEVIVSISQDNPLQNDNSRDPEKFIQHIIIYLIIAGILGGLTILYIKFKR